MQNIAGNGKTAVVILPKMTRILMTFYWQFYAFYDIKFTPLCLTLSSYIFSAKNTPIKTCRPYHIFSTLFLLCWHLLVFPVLTLVLPLLFTCFFFLFFLFYRSMASLSLRENVKSYPPPLHSFLLNCVFIAAAVHQRFSVAKFCRLVYETFEYVKRYGSSVPDCRPPFPFPFPPPPPAYSAAASVPPGTTFDAEMWMLC